MGGGVEGMQYRLLGPLEAVDGGRPLPLGGGKQRALLALLLLSANRVVSVEQIIDELWGESPPDTAANAVQVHVASLRRVLEPGRSGGASTAVLITRSPGYLLRAEPDDVDVLRFERLVDEAGQLLSRDPEAASGRLRQALSLRRGPALSDVVLQGPAHGQVTRLEEMYLSALEDRIQADLQLGRHGALVGELGALVAAHPVRERPRAQLMLALYRCGRQAEALEAYQAARRLLADELGIDPGTELQRLEREILHQDPALAWQAPGAAAPSRPTRSGGTAAVRAG
ncbi:MAG: AfsR/SARP family transcriptional regulator, partial [Candidatus Dormibacteria bacterium]